MTFKKESIGPGYVDDIKFEYGRNEIEIWKEKHSNMKAKYVKSRDDNDDYVLYIICVCAFQVLECGQVNWI